ncbi:MAG: rod shape-determining protein MreC [Deltaproteobacteria bacterium]|nr:rod shape-determining protein MreC [Deltaproteobacteria bacterium]
MSGPRQKLREVATVAATALVALFLLRQSARHPGELGMLDRGVLAVLSPVQGALSSVGRNIGNLAGRYVDLVHVRTENETFRRDNIRLRAELLEAKRGASETARLQRILELRDSITAETIAARVISVDTSPYFRIARVTLDRGEGSVTRGMPVITPEGVVGRIDRVAGSTADIQLAVDPRFAIDVFLPRSRGRGILRGKAGENGFRCAIEYLVRGQPAEVGDQVMSSGLGSNFPRDLPVGRVTRVIKAGTNGLYQEVEVTPDVDFVRLSEVLVVVAPPPAADPEANPRRTAAPARGVVMYR